MKIAINLDFFQITPRSAAAERKKKNFFNGTRTSERKVRNLIRNMFF